MSALPSRPCIWIDRDGEGRPRCEHGWAYSRGNNHWRCPLKHREANRRWDRTEKGRESKRRSNATEHARTTKALYELTRVRVI